MSYQVEQVWLPASERLLQWDDSFHDLMLGDRLRMTAYQAAITEAVRPGDTVLDLGTGTGILARWALEAGAARVYGIDLNKSVLDQAAENLAAAGFGDRFVPLHGLSFDLELPERVDLVVSEILGNLADNENAPVILDDARSRFLKPGGMMLPRQVESYLVPVAAEQALSQLAGGEVQDAGDKREFARLLDRRGARGPFDLYYDTILPLSGYLAAPRLLRRFEFDSPLESPDYQVELAFTAQRDGRFTGFKGYFAAALSATVALDISGDQVGETTSDSWKHCYLPVAEPVTVHQGDRIVLSFARVTEPDGDRTFRQGYRWSGRVISSPRSGTRTLTRFDHRTA
ncbi:methyltransferase domain-containing protein [Kitasatospora azatica]|uniref:methyltransferase domain-containing protein n=1 Tax=Kitasatospora azatica TaxID=58347 RepID=UPI00068DE6E0|nr:class I SAM-dependent methyltransferase [Kitasatospora azatica]